MKERSENYPFPVRAPAKKKPARGVFTVYAGKLLLVLLAGTCGLGLHYIAVRSSWHKPPGREKSVALPLRDEEWLQLVAGLEKDSRNYRGPVGIYFKDLETGRTWEHNPDTLFPSASLIKVPIMASVFEKIRQGGMTPDTQFKLAPGDRVGGSGSLRFARIGTSLSVMEIVYKMITESDNTATRMLINRLGMDFLGETFKELSLSSTNITPEGMSLTSGRPLRENFTTAREMASLLERIYAGELVSREASETMLDVLKHNKNRSRLRKGLPAGWALGHKTGLLRRACHDVGIVFSPRGDYVLAVLTGHAPDYTSAKNFITKVAGLTYKYYKPDPAYAQGVRPPPRGTAARTTS